MQRIRTIALSAAAAAAIAQPAAADTWVFDASHSGAYFSVRHMMVSNVRGSFGKIDGSVEFDGKNVAALKVQATGSSNSSGT